MINKWKTRHLEVRSSGVKIDGKERKVDDE